MQSLVVEFTEVIKMGHTRNAETESNYQASLDRAYTQIHINYATQKQTLFKTSMSKKQQEKLNCSCVTLLSVKRLNSKRLILIFN